MAFTIPFDMSFPVSSMVFLAVDCLLVMVAIIVSDMIISHGIEIKKVVIMSLIAYIFAPIFGSLLSPYIAIQIPYLLPLLFWIIVGEFLLNDLELKKRALVAALGFIIYLLMTYIGISTMIVYFLRI